MFSIERVCYMLSSDVNGDLLDLVSQCPTKVIAHRRSVIKANFNYSEDYLNLFKECVRYIEDSISVGLFTSTLNIPLYLYQDENYLKLIIADLSKQLTSLGYIFSYEYVHGFALIPNHYKIVIDWS